MINYQGDIIDLNALPVQDVKRATMYGDAVFETIRMRDNKLLFVEDHYFRLMASMRILRMPIPMEFTPEFFVDEANRLAEEVAVTDGRLRLQVVRKSEGKYTPDDNKECVWWMELEELSTQD